MHVEGNAIILFLISREIELESGRPSQVVLSWLCRKARIYLGSDVTVFTCHSPLPTQPQMYV